MPTNFHDVGDFHEKFGLPVVRHPGDGMGPQGWSDELMEFRLRFLAEELKEFEEGVQQQDHAKMADALIDLVYVAMGTAHHLGYPWQELWSEVQRANMTKQRAQADGSDSARGSSLDVVKPPGWEPPDVESILRRYGFFTACAECRHSAEVHRGSRCLTCEG